YRVHGKNAWFTTDRKKPLDFVNAVDCYLNQKLVESGRTPCISFYDSMYSWASFVGDGRWGSLIASMCKLTATQRDTKTLNFVYETLKTIFYKTNLQRFTIFHRIIRITRPLRIRIFGW